MRIENEFFVDAPIERVWTYLLNVQRVAPCAPGAELTELVDERTYEGKLNVKVGPVSMSFAGKAVLEEQDKDAYRAVIKAEGREQRGKGAASALVTSRLESMDDRTRVVIETDLTITGAVAQYGRGMIRDVSQRLTKEFAECLQASIAEPGGAELAADEAPVGSRSRATRPVRGVRLVLWSLWRAFIRLIRRLFGSRAA